MDEVTGRLTCICISMWIGTNCSSFNSFPAGTASTRAADALFQENSSTIFAAFSAALTR